METGFIVLSARERAAHVGTNREVFECLVGIEHQVAVEALIGIVGVAIEAIVGVSEEVDGRSIALVLSLVVGAVETNAACHVEPVEDVVLQACVSHIAMLVVGAIHAISHPIWVLHLQCVAKVPVLNVDATCLVIYFKCALSGILPGYTR